MMEEEQRGRVVMIHPEFYDDPADKRGEIGSITASDPAEDLYRVRFEDERIGLYASNALLTFKAPEQIYQHLKHEVIQLTPQTFKDLKNIALLLDYGTPEKQRTAMKIAQKNPDVLSAALVSLEESLALNRSFKRGR